MKTIYKKLLFLLLLLPFSVLAQNTLSGTVVDKNSKQPIPGVNVVIQGSASGTQTDFDGKYSLPVKKGDVVVFSYLGYKSFTVTYDAQKNLSVSLEEEANVLGEVVVQVGYGSVRKKDATGSVALITEKDFNKGAIVSVDQLLTGKAAGVRITNSGGSPDADPNIRIRGGGSLGASNKPLVVIDGVPISADNPAGISNPLTLINPNDVESVSVLKDASATAIYGVRASNGVLIITTKKGTSGTPQFNYSSNVSMSKVGRKLDMMDGEQYTNFIRTYHPDHLDELGIPDGTGTIDNPATEAIEGRILYNTDWQDAVFRTAISSDHNFSARANLYGKIPFRFSLGYNNTQGLIKTSDYERFSYALKMTPTFFDNHLKIDVNAKGSYSDKNAIDNDGSLGGVVNMDPTKPIYTIDQKFGGYYQPTNLTNSNTIDGAWNPVAVLEQRRRPERVLRFLGNIEFDYKFHFLPELRAVLNLGLDASESRIRETYYDNAIATYRTLNSATDFVFNPGKNYLENQTFSNKTWDSYLNYNKSFGEILQKLDVTAGYSYQSFVNDGNKEVYRYPDATGIRERVYSANDRYYNPLVLESYFARVNMDLFGKYLLTGTFRTDASSLFRGSENQWGYFPSAALAWKVKEESFLKNVDLVQDLKVRIGWGKTGNSDISGEVGYFPSSPLFEVGSGTSQYFPGVNLYSAKNYDPNVTWETSETLNAGLDFGFFKRNILTGSFDIYKRFTKDLLSRYTLPPGQGLSDTFVSNVGEIESKGFELALDINAIQKDNFNLSFNGNVAYNYAEVTDLKGISRIAAKDGNLPTGTNVTLAYHGVGFQPFSAWVFQQVYDGNGKAIIGAVSDLNGDGKINNEDRYYKALRPNWTYGFGFNMNYLNFDLSSSFRGQVGGQTYNTKKLVAGFTDRADAGTAGSLNNIIDINNSDNGPIITNFNDGVTQFSDYMLEDASFLRCENVTLGYKFNKFVGKSTLRLYASASNLFIITDYSGQDPENFNGMDNNFYPRPRVYTFGVNLDF
ncbi:SusC/RagA family TonB-linked outer membrane protein [Flavobacterium sp.]|uniref:SusC/RagA family TonB-linked outer membrane protein n=1 Tax=Flavobacterium sp. TaxID=239 RepID=UPI0039E2AA45